MIQIKKVPRSGRISSSLMFMLCILLSPQAFCQKAGNAVVSLDTLYAIPGTTVDLPVIFSGWNQPGVNAISIDMYITDTNVIGFRGLHDFCPAIPGFNAGNTNYLSSNQHIYVAWSSLTSATVASDTLMNIALYYKGGTAAVEFNEQSGQCEIADFDGISYTTVWNNGLVSVSTNAQKPKAAVENNLIVYPNPSDETVFFNFPGKQETKITVTLFDQVGAKVQEQSRIMSAANDNVVELTVKSLPEGFYYYNAEMLTKGISIKSTGKIIVKH